MIAMTKDEALKMASEAMNSAYSSHGKILPSYPAQDAWLYHGCDAKLFKALQACKEALEQPAQEPVAWLSTDSKANEIIKSHPAPSWQGLSAAEIKDLANFWDISDIKIEPFIEKVIQRVVEKNAVLYTLI